jgi:hypothetical protein
MFLVLSVRTDEFLPAETPGESDEDDDESDEDDDESDENPSRRLIAAVRETT